jgi:hypothetical protein
MGMGLAAFLNNGQFNGGVYSYQASLAQLYNLTVSCWTSRLVLTWSRRWAMTRLRGPELLDYTNAASRLPRVN